MKKASHRLGGYTRSMSIAEESAASVDAIFYEREHGSAPFDIATERPPGSDTNTDGEPTSLLPPAVVSLKFQENISN